jgi:transketolase
MLWNKYDRIDLYNNVITNTVFLISFGKSVPVQQLADYFSFTPEKITQKSLNFVMGR